MLVLVTYDVNVSSAAGQRRLRKVAKLCERHGLRVQNSVFEVLVDAAQLAKLKNDLALTIDHEQDSVRFYRLGNHYQSKIDSMGRTGLIQTGEPLLL
ncbi:CRISPR-associated endonuclease Cas2 [uncultured Flavonifractor sp.]|uniref:CRISPR-associated endonuclease Cas2 n=1 Tax=uncultured Flavonifractor sp. TaxID=1193534 RepID=UPI0017488B95|nr:CRISPR-associated endonuclease Cas2 [uncultured Flavonifractor sp.]